MITAFFSRSLFTRRRLNPALLFALLCALTSVSHGNHAGPVPAPTGGFGAPGPFAVRTETLPSPSGPDHVVTAFLPEDAPGPRPVWFFCHGFAGTDAAFYDELLRHLASHGAIVFFSPYPANLLRIAENYSILYDGFIAAATHYAPRIDLTRIGFAGHSYGGGAVPALALRALRERGWGSNGLALFILAPWFSAFVSDADLASFPPHTQALVQVYEDDLMNDHRMAIDLFHHLGVSADNKDYLMLRSDRIDGYNYAANHRVPTGINTPGATLNALDTWGVHRLAQALAASAFSGDPTARAVGLGHGNHTQTQMGAAASGRALRPIVQSADPAPQFPSSRYIQRFDSPLNPRRDTSLPSPINQTRLTNLSARAHAASADDALIVGSVLAGDRPKSLLIRAVGPALRDIGLADAMPDPRLSIFRGQTLDLEIDNWSDTPDPDALGAASVEVGAMPLPHDSNDAAVLASFPPGAMTAVASSHHPDFPGLAVLELYAADNNTSALINLSARARAGSDDDVLIAGFVIAGDTPLRLLVRGLGPALAPAGVSHPLTNPFLRLFRGSEPIAANDDWSASTAEAYALAAAALAVGASELETGSMDAALLVDLPPGVYTAQLSPADCQAGVGLIEVYVVP